VLMNPSTMLRPEGGVKGVAFSSKPDSSAPIGVIFPVFNEHRWLDSILDRLFARPEVAQVAAVDDGSTDNSWERLQHWKERDSRLLVFRQPENRGKGAAIRTALEHLQTPLVLIQDADLEYDPADYPKLLAPIQRGEADVVYGSRFSAGANGNPKWHTLGNRLLTFACNRLTGLRLTDEATCYKLFKRELLVGMNLQEERFGFCPEVTAKVSRLVREGTARLVEVPISYHGRSRAEGKKIQLRDGIAALYCLWKYSRPERSGRGSPDHHENAIPRA
jgi:glycosyltransferase involved in cell wall biosynthesis